MTNLPILAGRGTTCPVRMVARTAMLSLVNLQPDTALSLQPEGPADIKILRRV